MSAILKKSGDDRIYFHSLDLLRALAALLVVLSHARNCFLGDCQPGFNLGWKLFYFISDLGHEAVIVFFVLSGCVVGRIVLRGAQEGTWSWPDYLLDRLTRLWIVLIPALALTALIDHVTIAFSRPGSFIHTGADFGHVFAQPPAAHLSATTFLGNLLYLQTILVPTYGSNSLLWSLANEFWYYLAFPLLYLGWKSDDEPQKRISLVACGFMILFFIGWKIAALFPVWLLGAAAFALYQKFPPSPSRIKPGLWITAGITAAVLVLDRTDILPPILGDILSNNILGLVCAGFIYFALAAKPSQAVSRTAGFFSKFSYSVYLLHLPVIALIASVYIGSNNLRFSPSPLSLLLIIGVLSGIYLYAYGVYLLTENKTQALRRWLRTRLGL